MDAAPPSDAGIRGVDVVSAVFTQRVKQGHEAEFETLLGEILALAERHPGHLSTDVLRAGQIAPVYTIVGRFSSEAALRSWLTSDGRRRLVERAQLLGDGNLNVQQASGLESWFQLPGQPLVLPPPRYKMAVVSWVGIMPLLLLANVIVAPHLGALPSWGRPIPGSIVMIMLMTYLVMPTLTRWLRWWLYPSPKPDSSTSQRRKLRGS
jgi:uncharacterized protein